MNTNSSLIVSSSPHLHAPETTAGIMRWVVVALAPAFGVALYNFGWRAGFIALLTVAACMATEFICVKWRKKKSTLSDFSAVVSGLLLAATLPPNIAWWMPIIGGVFAMAIVKHAFGGLGSNLWNPALAARAFLQISFPTSLNSPEWLNINSHLNFWERGKIWLTGSPSDYLQSQQAAAENIAQFIRENGGAVAGKISLPVDVVASATPLTALKSLAVNSASAISDISASAPSIKQLLGTDYPAMLRATFSGLEGGTIAETSAIALIVGGVFLIAKKIIDWQTPIAYLLTVALLTWILPAPYFMNGEREFSAWFGGVPLLQIGAGGAMLAAFFMDTDYATTPLTRVGKILFAVGAGCITALIRLYSPSYPEGCCYSLLIMNTCVPWLDAFTRPRRK